MLLVVVVVVASTASKAHQQHTMQLWAELCRLRNATTNRKKRNNGRKKRGSVCIRTMEMENRITKQRI